ncbi:AAA family ATPase [Chloroflexota bacterium]
MAKKKLRKLRISGFRGIRHKLSIDFTRINESVLIYGANAKGKSSIGDAFEWYFTGEVKELTKEGCTRADYRHRLLESDEDAVVGIELSEPALNSVFRLNSTRRQKQTNDCDDFSEYLLISKDELLILRHKDLKQFVDETKGEKRKQIAQLIGMDGWENIRTDMGTVENRLISLLDQKKQMIKDRQNEVIELIGSEGFTEEQCWEFAEDLAKILGLEVTISSLDDLRSTDEIAKETTKGTDRSGKLAELKAAEDLLKGAKTKSLNIEDLKNFETQYNSITANPHKVLCVQLNTLYTQGKSLLESGKWTEDSCPLCGADIPQDELMSHIQEHQETNKDVLEEIAVFERTREKARNELKTISNLVEQINALKLTGVDGLDRLKEIVTEVALAVGSANSIVEQPLKTNSSVSFKEVKLSDKYNTLLSQSETTLISVNKEQKALSPTKEETTKIEAFQILSNLSSHMARIATMEDEIKPLETQVSSMQAFTSGFQQLRRETMGAVLEAISDDVSRYFLALHPDEGFDDIQLKFLPEEDGVEFHIYYKGDEITPPRKFLSESYLSGLGVCLFLATVRAFNKENGFVVLDDIVNSFDAEHRANLSRLLVNELVDHQLIVLTHDSVWFDLFRRLAKRGWQHKRITRWSYEDGVEIETSQAELLAECREALESCKVEVAAPRVRIFIENRLKTLMKKLGGKVRFREGTANDERVAGELIFELRGYLSGGGFFEFADVTCFDELEASTFIANYGSHDRPPAPVGLSIGDVRFALERMIGLEELFICPSCNKKIWNVVGRNFEMQCKCGEYYL